MLISSNSPQFNESFIQQKLVLVYPNSFIIFLVPILDVIFLIFFCRETDSTADYVANIDHFEMNHLHMEKVFPLNIKLRSFIKNWKARKLNTNIIWNNTLRIKNMKATNER